MDFSDRADWKKRTGRGTVKDSLGNVLGERFNRGTIKGYARKKGKKFASATGKTIGAAAMTAALSPAILAAAMASGDLTNVFKYGAATSAIGSKLGSSSVDSLTKAEKRTRDSFRKVHLGTDEFNERNTFAKLRENRDFQDLCKGKKRDEQRALVRKFMQSGITDEDDIISALTARKTYMDSDQHERAKGFEITDDILVKMAAANKGFGSSVWGDPDKRQKLLDNVFGQTGDRRGTQAFNYIIQNMRS